MSAALHFRLYSRRAFRYRFRRMQKERKFNADTDWLLARLKEKGFSIRAIARILKCDASNVSRLFRGFQPIRIEQAAVMAPLLNVSLDELLRRFGVYVNERSLPIVSTADGSLTLHRRPVPHAYPPVPVPSSLPPHAVGALCTDKDCNTFGWVFAYAPLENIAPAAIGRLALIRLRDGTELIRFLKPAIRLGRFDLVPLSAARPFPDVEIEAASPILFMQT